MFLTKSSLNFLRLNRNNFSTNSIPIVDNVFHSSTTSTETFNETEKPFVHFNKHFYDVTRPPFSFLVRDKKYNVYSSSIFLHHYTLDKETNKRKSKFLVLERAKKNRTCYPIGTVCEEKVDPFETAFECFTKTIRTNYLKVYPDQQQIEAAKAEGREPDEPKSIEIRDILRIDNIILSGNIYRNPDAYHVYYILSIDPQYYQIFNNRIRSMSSDDYKLRWLDFFTSSEELKQNNNDKEKNARYENSNHYLTRAFFRIAKTLNFDKRSLHPLVFKNHLNSPKDERNYKKMEEKKKLKLAALNGEVKEEFKEETKEEVKELVKEDVKEEK